MQTIIAISSLHFYGHFPGGRGLASTRMSPFDFIGAKGDSDGGNKWSYKTCKAPVNMSPPTNQHQVTKIIYNKILFWSSEYYNGNINTDM